MVAQEVKKLDEVSVEAVKNIDVIISEIAKSVKGAQVILSETEKAFFDIAANFNEIINKTEIMEDKFNSTSKKIDELNKIIKDFNLPKVNRVCYEFTKDLETKNQLIDDEHRKLIAHIPSMDRRLAAYIREQEE